MKILDIFGVHNGELQKLVILMIGIIILIAILKFFDFKEMLQGLFVGLGVIIANELWTSFKRYREHVSKNIKGKIREME
jgi:hypothetical protein